MTIEFWAKWLAGLVTVSLATMIGCGGGGGAAVQQQPPPPAVIAVSVSASSVALGSNQTSNLTAAVSNDSQNAGVTWAMPAGSPGTLSTVSPFKATYTSGVVTQSGSVTITATSVADTSKSASVTIALAPSLAVVISPASADLGGGQIASFTASVADDPSNAGVTWALPQGAPGALSQQTATSVTYTAPASISSAGSVALTATSVADTSVSSTSTINLHPVSLTLGAAATTSVGPLETSRLTAQLQYGSQGVTWAASVGMVTPLDSGCASGASCCPNGTCQAIYSAPAAIASNTTAKVTVTSVDNSAQAQSDTITLTAPAAPAWEDLVAFSNGHELGALKPYADLEVGGQSTGMFQPDRMIFHEVGLGSNGQPIGTEIWMLDNDVPPPSTQGASPPEWYIPGTLNRTPWNANGSYFDLGGSPCIPFDFYCADKTTENGGDLHSYLYSGDGSTQQLIDPIDPDPERGTGNQSYRQNQLGLAAGQYLAWDRINPDLFYMVTAGDNDYADGTTHSYLYSVDLSKAFQMAKVAAFPSPLTPVPTGGNPDQCDFGTGCVDPVTGQAIARSIISYPSEDDMIMVLDDNSNANSAGVPDYIPNIYMVDVNPNHATFDKVIYQYPINFNPTYPTNCPANLNCVTPPANDEYHFHDVYFQRDSADHFIFNYGTRGAAGEGYFFQASADGKTVNIMYPDPLGTPYLSHPAWNFDGTEASYGGYDTVGDSQSCCGFGNWVRSIGPSGFLYDGSIVGNMSAFDVGHQGWDGYDPNYDVFDGYSTSADANGNAMWSELSGTPNSLTPQFRVLVDDGLRNAQEVGNGTEPGILYGPVQSPDATKMMFVKQWDLTASSGPGTTTDVYMAVDHRPFPPSLAASVSGSSVTLTITPNASHPHKEVAGYHVYSSPDGTTWTEIVGANNSAAFHSIPADPVNPITATETLPNGTVYYAVTSQEYSGLESSELSNQVQVASGGAVNDNYAAAGATGWDTTAPQPPSKFQACEMTAPSGSAGTEWKLTWTASPSMSQRYYNIYYSGGGIPTIQPGDWVALQHYLINSPSEAQTSYIYWQANPSDVPAFGIIAVDRQDQASTPLYVQTSLPPQACQ